jgi:hypothetical protein
MYTETATPKDLADQNQFNQNFGFKTADAWDFEKKSWNYDLESDRAKQLVEKDFELLKECEKAFTARAPKHPKNGDALVMPCGGLVYFCHTWDDSAQTTPNGSFALSDAGGISYSGGLDSGMKLADIYLTEETAFLPVWICHQNRLKAGARVNATVKTRVWKCLPEADLTGVQLRRNY